MKKILAIAFIILISSSVLLLGIYKYSGTKNQIPKTGTPESAPITPPIIVEIKENATRTSATSTETNKNPPAKLGVVTATTTNKTIVTTKIVTPPQATTTPVTPEIPPEPPPDFGLINTFARTALVNILCSTKGNELSPISGSGIVISPSGIILTNAHLGQYFLLRDLYEKNYLQCAIRTGSPAYPRYHAELVYISPLWVEANKKILREAEQASNGENDYAFLHITDAIDGTKLPVFPYLTANTSENINADEPVILVSYPAGFLGGLSILQGLNVTSAVTTIQNVFTFKSGTKDVMGVGGTIVSQRGASGGGVIDGHSTLIGIISTLSNASTTSSRDLNAITVPYINRSLKNEAGITIPDLLTLDVSIFAKNFWDNQAPALIKTITDAIASQ